MRAEEVVNGLAGAAKASDQWLDNEGGFIANGLSYMIPGYGDYRAYTDLKDDWQSMKQGGEGSASMGDVALDAALFGLGLVPIIGDVGSAVGKLAKAGAKATAKSAKLAGREAAGVGKALEPFTNVASMRQLKNQARAAGSEKAAAEEAKGFFNTLQEARAGQMKKADEALRQRQATNIADKTVTRRKANQAAWDRLPEEYLEAARTANIGGTPKTVEELEDFFTRMGGFDNFQQYAGAVPAELAAARQAYLGRGARPADITRDTAMRQAMESMKSNPIEWTAGDSFRNLPIDLAAAIEDLWSSAGKWGRTGLIGGRAGLLSLLNDPRLVQEVEASR